MKRRTQSRAPVAIVCSGLVALACTAPARFREVPLGATPDEVRTLLGEPRDRQQHRKHPVPEHYFGPRPSDAYLALPDGTPLESWRYRHFRETWGYTFRLDTDPPVLVDKSYHHPDIVY